MSWTPHKNYYNFLNENLIIVLYDSNMSILRRIQGMTQGTGFVIQAFGSRVLAMTKVDCLISHATAKPGGGI
jgi:hypothetical protein